MPHSSGVRTTTMESLGLNRKNSRYITRYTQSPTSATSMESAYICARLNSVANTTSIPVGRKEHVSATISTITMSSSWVI